MTKIDGKIISNYWDFVNNWEYGLATNTSQKPLIYFT